MRILFLGNNWLGWKVLEWLFRENEAVIGAVVHPLNRQKYGPEILQIAQAFNIKVFCATELHEEGVMEEIRSFNPSIGISILFGYVLKPDFLNIFPEGVINLHPSYLPYNRGAFPNVWSILDHTPAGATLHYIDKGIDTGDILAQQKTPVAPFDTAKTLYEKLENTALELFKKNWAKIKENKLVAFPQTETGTYHETKDVERIDAIDLDRKYTARELIDTIRARTFPPHRGVYFFYEGRRIYMEMNLYPEDSHDK